MIIWRNEFSSPGREDSAISRDPPPGPVEITRVEEHAGNYHVWFAAVPARPRHDPAATTMPRFPG